VLQILKKRFHGAAESVTALRARAITM
jgi:hypothetical protein